MASFAADLKRLSANCEFGAYLDEALWDSLVCGLNNSEEAVNRNSARALEVALSNETANVRTRQLQSPGSAGLAKMFVQSPGNLFMLWES